MKPDCIIVLPHKIEKPGTLSLQTQSRLELALSHYQRVEGVPIVLSGSEFVQEVDVQIALLMRDFLIERGVPKYHLYEEINSRDTVGDALFTMRHIVSLQDWKKILVVTSDYHVKRASTIFQFIFGDPYHLEFSGCGGFGRPDIELAEQSSMHAFKETFSDCLPGDTDGIFKMLINRHPYYNGQIYPRWVRGKIRSADF